jgi:hypothetical protein
LPEVDYKLEIIDDPSYKGLPIMMMPLAAASTVASQKKVIAFEGTNTG